MSVLPWLLKLLINIRKSVKMTLFQQKNHVIKQIIDTNSQITQIVNHFTENSCLLDITIQTDEPEKKNSGLELRNKTSHSDHFCFILFKNCETFLPSSYDIFFIYNIFSKT